MNLNILKTFAIEARRKLMHYVADKVVFVLAAESAARRSSPQSVKELEEAIRKQGQEQVIEATAYMWFNRFCALRFMDANHYSPIGVVTPAEGATRPEILTEAIAGNYDINVSETTKQRVLALLSGETPSNDRFNDAYRILFIAACNGWSAIMPFMFEKINDYTELLMPDDLLSANSILAELREAISVEDCQDVELIGWLYQFYISERKDEVFDGLKKNRKIPKEDIPAATELFTPHWIVQFMVENSLGRIWLENHPDSSLAEQFQFYIKAESTGKYPKISSPEEIRICDPCCGSGHTLVYAFDVLYAIYAECGYDSTEIPSKILENNLYGLELDPRAAALAAFALVMKARQRYRRFLTARNIVQPHICLLRNVEFTDQEIAEYTETVGRDFFTIPFFETMHQFTDAENLGSLIVPRLQDSTDVREAIDAKNVAGNLYLQDTHKKVLRLLEMSDYLAPRYHVVVTNPPYMGSKGMNAQLKEYLEKYYSDSKADLMTCFMERVLKMILPDCYYAMINIPSWMFLGSFEQLRLNIVNNSLITSLLHLGRGIFGADFGTVVFVIQNQKPNGEKGYYRRLFEQHVQVRTVEKIKELFLSRDYNHFEFNQLSYMDIPGCPIAYWVSEQFVNSFVRGQSAGQLFPVKKGMDTSDNEYFLRYWFETALNHFSKGIVSSGTKWYPYDKGGEFRRWYGNKEYVVNYENNGYELSQSKANLRSKQLYFKNHLTWNALTASLTSFRYSDYSSIFDSAGSSMFPKQGDVFYILGLMNSKILDAVQKVINPTINYGAGSIAETPVIIDELSREKIESLVTWNITNCKIDWDYLETSWDFQRHPLSIVTPGCKIQIATKFGNEEWQEHRVPDLRLRYHEWEQECEQRFNQLKANEEELNRIFIEIYGLQDELKPDVEDKDVTVSKADLGRDIRSFLSYAVGCMFGRYSLDKPGLVLANQGEALADYLKQIPQPTFMPDANNVIPILDEDWFADDIVTRFNEFLKVTFGEENFYENLAFIEEALGKDVRSYFTKDFYKDHLQRYHNRPIYWLFSSPKGAFNALVYMHRYRPETVGLVLTYLRSHITKVTERIHTLEITIDSANSTAGMKSKAIRERGKLQKSLGELEDYERDVLYPLATEKIAINLDDGVKVNYRKFGDALYKIKGLEAKEE